MIDYLYEVRGKKINDIKYKYDGKKIEKVKLSRDFIEKNSKLDHRFIKYGWEIDGIDCTFGSLSTALDFLDGIV